MIVSKQCLIKFKVGNFYNSVLCDMVPMYACHMLLGRPWKYDRNIIYDGHKNIVLVVKGGKKTRINPLKEDINDKGSENS